MAYSPVADMESEALDDYHAKTEFFMDMGVTAVTLFLYNIATDVTLLLLPDLTSRAAVTVPLAVLLGWLLHCWGADRRRQEKIRRHMHASAQGISLEARTRQGHT